MIFIKNTNTMIEVININEKDKNIITQSLWAFLSHCKGIMTKPKNSNEYSKYALHRVNALACLKTKVTEVKKYKIEIDKALFVLKLQAPQKTIAINQLLIKLDQKTSLA